MHSVWLHVHVPKAGGSTLRQLMNRTFGEGYYNSNSLLETKQYTHDDVSEIVRCHPWVKCMSDHKLSLDLPYDHEHANVNALAYVRDPVERFISRYFFHRHFEEVNCIAQRMSFREFAKAELVDNYVHPQTNSQIYFLNQGRGPTDMSVIQHAIASGKAHLFPIERFDESCICMERLYPMVFSDLSYVRANVSKKDATISDEDRAFALQHLQQDVPVFELAEKHLNETLDRAFHSHDDRASALAEFQDRCSRRHHNFLPPRPPGVPAPAVVQTSSTNRQSQHKPHADAKDAKPAVPSTPPVPAAQQTPPAQSVAPAPTVPPAQAVTPEPPGPNAPKHVQHPAMKTKPTLKPKPTLQPKPELKPIPTLEAKEPQPSKPTDQAEGAA